MTTDPCLAPLAAALHALTLDENDEGYDADAGWYYPGSRDDLAAAILAALDATPAMLWDDLSYSAGLEDGQHEGRLENAAEIARLRADLDGLVAAGEWLSASAPVKPTAFQAKVTASRLADFREALARAKGNGG